MSRTVSPTYFVFEGDGGSNPPARPTIDQVGGANFTDCTEPGYAPIPDIQPMSADYNQLSLIAWAASRMMPVLKIGVTSGIPPTINAVVAVSRNVSLLLSANPDVQVTRASQGHWQIVVSTTKLPQSDSPPKAFANNAGACAVSAVWSSAGHYDVYTSDATGLIDAGFTLELSGY
jgi:hypothetical protein